ncbi:hypothetical protein AGMMS49546_15200 [Spirochaetia bacterium]|nr:hypothetical protein AGMMS49546_15200 [Spirochaetia bacterium]
MAKKEKAIYNPGELDRIRGKLGVTDAREANRLAKMLGGEVGVEKSLEPPKAPPRHRSETVEVVVGKGSGRSRSQPKHRVELAPEENEYLEKPIRKAAFTDPADDPMNPVKASYFERVKMDRFCALPDFIIKSQTQALVSMFSFFGEAPDYVNPQFVTKRLDEYYKRVELLVTSARSLFPRNNLKRNEKLKRTSPFVYSILDTIRRWDLEKITTEVAKLQAHPRNVMVVECSEFLKAIYRPLYILEQLETEAHIKGAFKLLYKILYIENPIEAKDRYQGLIRNALSGFSDLRREVHYRLYPLLMKLLSDRLLPYEMFFPDRRNRFMAFVGATETDQINPSSVNVQDEVDKNIAEDEKDESEEGEGDANDEEDPNDPEVIARKAKQVALESERKALDRGIATLEALFPKAGWDRLSEYPDMYPYFREVFGLKKGYELIAPTDPLLQIVVMMRILEELFFGLRYVNFGTITGPDEGTGRIDEFLGSIVNDWHQYIDTSFEKEYLPRLSEYCRILENSAESRTSAYAKRTLNELNWAKRLYFLPYYKFESLFPPPFQKKDITPLYPEIRRLRRSLMAVAAGIEQGYKRGGAEKMAPCEGIDNPWDAYNFEVPNPVSRRLDALLGPKKRNNASLVFFSLAVTAVLDHVVNDESSWAYNERRGTLFRSVNGEGAIPQFGVDEKIDADALFKSAMKARQKRVEGNKGL